MTRIIIIIIIIFSKFMIFLHFKKILHYCHLQCACVYVCFFLCAILKATSSTDQKPSNKDFSFLHILFVCMQFVTIFDNILMIDAIFLLCVFLYFVTYSCAIKIYDKI